MWTSQYWKFDHPYTWVNSGGLGTMGFAVPAAIGAKVGRPDAMVWAVDGDGCFQMTAQELVTAAAERIPVKIAILNNAYLGMVRQWQEMFYEERYSEVYLSPDLPDYKLWAEAMGCVGMRVESPEEVESAIQKANEIDDRPVVIDFRTDSLGEGVPDGRRRRQQRRHHHRPRPREGHRPVTTTRRIQHHILSVLVENKAGVLARVSGLFARRGFNIISLAVAPTEDERFSRITIAVDVGVGPARAGHQAALQADQRGEDHRARPARRRRAGAACSSPSTPRRPPAARSSSWSTCSRDASSTSATTASPSPSTGHPDKLDDFEELLRPYGIVELAAHRPGRPAEARQRRRSAAPLRLTTDWYRHPGHRTWCPLAHDGSDD